MSKLERADDSLSAKTALSDTRLELARKDYFCARTPNTCARLQLGPEAFNFTTRGGHLGHVKEVEGAGVQISKVPPEERDLKGRKTRGQEDG